MAQMLTHIVPIEVLQAARIAERRLEKVRKLAPEWLAGGKT
jgi:hypothetical protein